MFKTPIVVTPAWSQETRISKRSASVLNRYYLDNGFHPIFLNGIATLRPVFTRVLNNIRKNEKPPHLLVYFGHGLSDSLLGVEPIGMRHKNLRPVVANQNPSVLKDYIVYAVACDSLSELGYKAIEHGATTYFSNMDPLHLLSSDLNDNGISDFTEIFTTIPIALAQRKTTQQAYNIFQSTINDLLLLTPSSSHEYNLLYGMMQTFDIIGKDVLWY